MMASLACRMSTHRQISPDGFGVTTIGLTHDDGPSTGSRISRSCNSFCLTSTFSLMAKGILRTGCATGVTVSSIGKVSLKFSNFHTPLKYFPYFVNKSDSERKIFIQIQISRSVAVLGPNSACPLPRMTMISAFTDDLPTAMSVMKLPIVSSGLELP